MEKPFQKTPVLGYYWQQKRFNKEAAMTNRNKIPSSGTVTARNCPTCGHHEIGLVLEDGVFRPLKTGTRVVILDETEPGQIPTQALNTPPTTETLKEPSLTLLEGRYWVPEPLRGDRRMRLKYGVVIQEQAETAPVNSHIYESAYLRKLHYLLEKEVYVPIAVILDRFFVAPHLATGETRDMAANMWEELEEIRLPVEQVKQWLIKPNEETLKDLIHPGTVPELEHAPISEEAALEEQRALDLEDFLTLL